MKKPVAVFVCFCALAYALSARSTRADAIVVPNPHVTFNSIPFGPSPDGRYQQVYSSSLFPGPMEVTALGFSPDTTGLYQANVTIRFATTARAVGALSSNLDSNVSGPITTVFTNPSFSQSVTGGTDTFSLVFGFSTTPFFYDPHPGQNLLLDVLISGKSYSGFGFSRADANAFSSRAWNIVGTNGADGVALRTKVTFNTVPEPSTFALAALGAAALLAARRRFPQSAWERS